ncbi:MAG: SDR family oxidoreductase [candidate division Zixibacteria bacterium]|nr:SDR family oxidoreductase [candidate division Zixibacteria bacterium]
MKILIAGGAGLLGSELVRRLGGIHEVTATYHTQSPPAGVSTLRVDLSNIAEVQSLFGGQRFDVVINAAGAAAVDRCEQDHQHAEVGNIAIPRSLVQALAASKTHLYHISTDYVFDGEAGPYDETAQARPINYYGATKWHGEQVIAASGQPATIVRVCSLYSLDLGVRSNLYNSVVAALAQGQQYVAATDLWSNPTNVADVADAFADLLALGATPPVIHLAGREHLSRHAFACRVARHAGYDSAHVLAATTAELKLKAVRPRRAGLISRQAAALLGHDLPAFPQV